MSIVAERREHADSERLAFQFTLRLDGAVAIDQALEDAIFRAGCDDAVLYSTNGQLFLEFDRESETLVSAIVSAIHAVEECGSGIKVGEVIPPYAHEIGAINAALQVRNNGGAVLRELST
jgi:hypothetical protein